MGFLFKGSSLIKVAVIIVVMVFMAGQVAETKAGGWDRGWIGGGRHRGQEDCPDCPDAWDKILTDDRFELVMPTEVNPDGEGVRDNETCLVWERYPDITGGEITRNDGTRLWTDAITRCITKRQGGRGGWRLPTIEELHSLVDLDHPPPYEEPNIPAALKALTILAQGHYDYWSSTTSTEASSAAWFQDLGGWGFPTIASKNLNYLRTWCVRGGQGNDGY